MAAKLLKYCIRPVDSLLDVKALREIFAEDSSDAIPENVSEWLDFPRSVVLVVEDAKRALVGVISVIRSEDWAKGTPDILDVLYLIPKYRGRGIGTELTARALERIDSHDCVLYVKYDNLPAIRLYQNFGFTKVTDCYHRSGFGERLTIMERKYKAPTKGQAK